MIITAILILSTLVILALLLLQFLIYSTTPHIDISRIRLVSKIGSIVISISWIIHSFILYIQNGFSSIAFIDIVIAIIILIIFVIMKYIEYTKELEQNIVEIWNEETGKYEIIGSYKIRKFYKNKN